MDLRDLLRGAWGYLRKPTYMPLPTAPTAPIRPAAPATAVPVSPSPIKEPVMSDLTKFILDPLEKQLAPAAVPALQEFSNGLGQLLDNLLAKAGTFGEIGEPVVNLALALASAYGANLISSKLGTAVTPAQIPAALSTN